MSNNNLLDKTIDVNPVGVIYNVSGNDIKEFILNYLTALNVDGVANAGINVLRDGASRPDVAFYVIIDSNSKDVTSNMQNIPQHLKKKMDVGGYRASERLKKALIPICGGDIKLNVRDRYVVVKCNIFKVLALMFKAHPRMNTLAITEVAKFKGDCCLTVVKGLKFVSADNDNNDKFSRILRSMDNE